MIDPEEKEFQIAVGILEDCRRQIAAYKALRWDVVKWGVTINLALAVAAAAPTLADFRPYLLFSVVAWPSQVGTSLSTTIGA
jgi:hypothetical protein